MVIKELLFLVLLFKEELFFRFKTRDFKKRTSIDSREFGVNLAGYLDTESGLGEVIRSIVRIIERADVPFALNNIAQKSLRSSDNSYSSIFRGDNPYCVNILNVNADMVAYIANRLGLKWFENKYNIGYWFWELENFPKKFKLSFRCFDEIWVASDFCRASISKVSTLPVVKMPPAVEVKLKSSYNRSFFGLNEDSFVFLYIFDLMSYLERKNPFAVISAFRKAFSGCRDKNVMLVLKFSGSQRRGFVYKSILKAIQGLPVKIISSYMDRDSVYGLLSVSDCYVSLHRSEGFGLTIAEAMYLGKIAIATAYSGNMEFMNKENSLLVNFDMKKIDRDIGPYKRGNYWADPDVNHASELMKRAYEDKHNMDNLRVDASRYIRNNFSYDSLSRQFKHRLKEIFDMFDGARPQPFQGRR